MSILTPSDALLATSMRFRLPSDPERRNLGPVLLRLGAAWTPLNELAPQPRKPRPAVFENARWARVPVWTNRTSWLLHARFMIRSPKGTQLRRSYGGLSVITFMDIMRTDALTADGPTGRNVYTSHETVSHRTGHSTQAVRRARNIAERLGLAVTVDRGRYLPRRERFLAGRCQTHYQCRKASTRALTMSRLAVAFTASIQGTRTKAAQIGHLPRSGSVMLFSSLKRTHQARERARSRTSSTRPTLPTSAARKLAARLAILVPALGRTGHLNALASALERALGASSIKRWTAQNLLAQLDETMKTQGISRPNVLKNPAGWMTWILSQASLAPPTTADQLNEARQAVIEATRTAKARLEAAVSPEAKAQRAAGIALCRASLKQARTQNT